VSDADIRSRFSIDHYYEIDLFVPLATRACGSAMIRPAKTIRFIANKFPATLIVRDLPPGFPQGESA